MKAAQRVTLPNRYIFSLIFFSPCFVLIFPLGPICTGKFMMLRIILKYGLYLQWAKSPGRQIKAHRIWCSSAVPMPGHEHCDSQEYCGLELSLTPYSASLQQKGHCMRRSVQGQGPYSNFHLWSHKTQE